MGECGADIAERWDEGNLWRECCEELFYTALLCIELKRQHPTKGARKLLARSVMLRMTAEAWIVDFANRIGAFK